MSEPIDLAARIAARRASLGIPAVSTAPPVVPEPTPRVTFMESERDPNDELIDQAIAGLDIVTAYNRWSGKGTVDPGGRTEGIKVSCPNPGHPDRNPSAWLNTDKGTWFCAGCNEGGDLYDIAAWHFGHPVPGYKDGAAFHKLRRDIAADQGYTFQRLAGSVEVVIPPADAVVGPDGATHVSTPIPSLPDLSGVPVADAAGPSAVATEDDGVASVTSMPGIDALAEVESIELKWKPIVPHGTFLDIWMRQTTIDDVPEEYHFINGLLALSMTLGRDVTLQDYRPVYGNLFVCILGRTGSGKSKSQNYLHRLLERTLPYKHDDPANKGVLRVSAPASAEALIWTFQKLIFDPSAPKGSSPDPYPVRGIVDYNELSSLIGRTQRSGNILIPTLMQFYDMENRVETVSRTHGTETAIEPYACAVTTSQPKALRGLLTLGDAASGFLNRWFFAAGKEKKREALGGVVVDIEPCVKPLKDVQGWASAAGSLSWSQDAVEKWTSFFHNELVPVMKHDETELLNRMDLLCKKLILLFTANMRTKQVEVEAVEQMMMMYPYLLECYGIPGANVGSSLQNEIRLNVLKVIIDFQEKTGRGASLRDINQRLKHKKYPLDLYQRTVKFMQEIDEIQPVTMKPTGAGRPTVRFQVENLDEAKAMISTKPAEAKEAAK